LGFPVYDEQVRATTNGAVLAVFLAIPVAEVDGYDDLLATGLTDVAGLVVHGRRVQRPSAPHHDPSV